VSRLPRTRRGAGVRGRCSLLLAFVVALLGPTVAAAVNCTLNVQSVIFGSYDALSSQSVDSVGGVMVTCDAFASYSVTLSPGRGTFGARELQSASDVLYYNLYTDALRTFIWGDGAVGTVLVNGSGTTSSQVIYGRIPARQNVPAGVYTDVLTVTLLF
jgi:spore coat protein U-like protein